MKSWKTTAAGWGLGALNLYAHGITDPTQIAFSVGLAIFGMLAKDFNVTHSDGTIPHTREENADHIKGAKYHG